jgi:hypothetical protein
MHQTSALPEALGWQPTFDESDAARLMLARDGTASTLERVDTRCVCHFFAIDRRSIVAIVERSRCGGEGQSEQKQEQERHDVAAEAVQIARDATGKYAWCVRSERSTAAAPFATAAPLRRVGGDGDGGGDGGDGGANQGEATKVAPTHEPIEPIETIEVAVQPLEPLDRRLRALLRARSASLALTPLLSASGDDAKHSGAARSSPSLLRAAIAADDIRWGIATVSILLVTVTFHANHAHNLTRSP